MGGRRENGERSENFTFSNDAVGFLKTQHTTISMHILESYCRKFCYLDCYYYITFHTLHVQQQQQPTDQLYYAILFDVYNDIYMRVNLHQICTVQLILFYIDIHCSLHMHTKTQTRKTTCYY